MKSQLLQSFVRDVGPERAQVFAQQLREAMNLSKSELDACLRGLPQLRLVQTSAQQEKLLDELSQGDASSRPRIALSLSVLAVFFEALLHEELPAAEPEFWSEDLVELGWLDQKSRDVFDAIIARLRGAVAAVRPLLQRRSAARGILPSFTKFAVTVEVRAVQPAAFETGMPLEDYRPVTLDVVPVYSVQVGVDAGHPKDFYFQMGEDEIDQLIDALRAAKKDLASLKSYLKLQ